MHRLFSMNGICRRLRRQRMRRGGEGNLMMRGVFITGTDTGVGKTYVGTALAYLLTQRGMQVCPRKPVESGCLREGNRLLPPDATSLHEASRSHEPLERVCPYRLEAPLSPERAAALEGLPLSLERLVNACKAGVAKDDFLLIEGAGGFCSPLASDGLNADLALALDLPVLLVAADWLGAIHQVLVTAEAIDRRGLALAGVVLNRVAPAPDTRMDNAADLARWLGREVIAVPHWCTQGPSAWREIAPFLTGLADRLANDMDEKERLWP
ncbi:MAG: dethiobiotin synthase [Rhodanobacter sp.]